MSQNIIGEDNVELLFILQVVSHHYVERDDRGWWWPVDHPFWGQGLEPMPVFSTTGVEDLCAKGLARGAGPDDVGLGDGRHPEHFAPGSVVEITEAGKRVLAEARRRAERRKFNPPDDDSKH